MQILSLLSFITTGIRTDIGTNGASIYKAVGDERRNWAISGVDDIKGRAAGKLFPYGSAHLKSFKKLWLSQV